MLIAMQRLLCGSRATAHTPHSAPNARVGQLKTTGVIPVENVVGVNFMACLSFSFSEGQRG